MHKKPDFSKNMRKESHQKQRQLVATEKNTIFLKLKLQKEKNPKNNQILVKKSI
jgi:hypothetical protein